ncbi:uncharacterized protein LOC113586964 [Electrophorus electricus]|uniref:uncharacterized protein LOC113586964 n=1 Tax=Electrophorus electricus TaxID=8005 RepID=UPI0015D0D07E|nr:uncharacterized protein LOC113586964 [Electrophorus electricus]
MGCRLSGPWLGDGMGVNTQDLSHMPKQEALRILASYEQPITLQIEGRRGRSLQYHQASDCSTQTEGPWEPLRSLACGPSPVPHGLYSERPYYSHMTLPGDHGDRGRYEYLPNAPRDHDDLHAIASQDPELSSRAPEGQSCLTGCCNTNMQEPSNFQSQTEDEDYIIEKTVGYLPLHHELDSGLGWTDGSFQQGELSGMETEEGLEECHARRGGLGGGGSPSSESFISSELSDSGFYSVSTGEFLRFQRLLEKRMRLYNARMHHQGELCPREHRDNQKAHRELEAIPEALTVQPQNACVAVHPRGLFRVSSMQTRKADHPALNQHSSSSAALFTPHAALSTCSTPSSQRRLLPHQSSSGGMLRRSRTLHHRPVPVEHRRRASHPASPNYRSLTLHHYSRRLNYELPEESEPDMSYLANHPRHHANHSPHPSNHPSHPAKHSPIPANHHTHPANHSPHLSNHTSHPANFTSHSANHSPHLSSTHSTHPVSHSPHFSNHTTNSANHSPHIINHPAHPVSHSPHLSNHIKHPVNHSPHLSNHTTHPVNHSPHLSNHTTKSANHSPHLSNHPAHSVNHSPHLSNHPAHSVNHSPHLSNHPTQPVHYSPHLSNHPTQHTYSTKQPTQVMPPAPHTHPTHPSHAVSQPSVTSSTEDHHCALLQEHQYHDNRGRTPSSLRQDGSFVTAPPMSREREHQRGREEVKFGEKEREREARFHTLSHTPFQSQDANDTWPKPAARHGPYRTLEGHTSMNASVSARKPSAGSSNLRAVRNQLLRDRALRLADERSGMSTDEESHGEVRMGRYWSRTERREHMQEKQRQQHARGCGAHPLGDRPGGEGGYHTLLELSQRKLSRLRNRKLLDDWTTVEELLAHGTRIGAGDEALQLASSLLTVTTV